MLMLERPGGPEHLVVFISSDPNLDEKVQELQRRNFRVFVLHHTQQANRKPTNSMNVADEAYDWLTYLKQELRMPQLTLPPHKSGSNAPEPPHGQNGTMHTPPRPPPPPAYVASVPRSNSSSKTLPLPYQPGNQPRPLSAGPPPPANRQVSIVNGVQLGNQQNTVGPKSNTRQYVTVQSTAGPSSNPLALQHTAGLSSNPRQPMTAQNTAVPSSNPRQPGMTAARSHQPRNGPGNVLFRIIPDLLPEDSDSSSSRNHAPAPALYLPSKPQPGAKAASNSGPTDVQVHMCSACM